MQRPQTLQNDQFGSKIKNAINVRKTILQQHQSCSVQKTAQKTTKYSRNETILEISHVERLQPMHRLQPLQNGQFGSKTKNAKNAQKTILLEHYSCSLQKTAQKTSNIRGMRRFSKSAILQRLQPMQRLQPLQNGYFGSKIKNAKTVQKKTVLQEQYSCSVQKTAR